MNKAQRKAVNEIRFRLANSFDAVYNLWDSEIAKVNGEVEDQASLETAMEHIKKASECLAPFDHV